MANLFSYGNDSWCFHECERDLIHNDPDYQMEVMLDRMEAKRHDCVGNASSGMLPMDGLGQFGPVVIISRNWEQVEESIGFAMLEWGKPDLAWDMDMIRSEHTQACLANPQALHVDFDHLFDPDILMRIWKHCFTFLLPPRDRFEELIRYRVTMKEWAYPEIPDFGAVIDE